MSGAPRSRLVSLVTAGAFGGAIVLIWALGPSSGRHLLASLLASYLLGWAALFAASSRDRSELHLRFLLVAASLAVTLVLVEAAGLARLVDYRMIFGSRHPHAWISAGNRFDPELLSVRRPHLQLRGRRDRGNLAESWCLPPSGAGYQHELAYDRNGFRNPTDLTRAEIAVVGDSYVEAVESRQERTLTALLAEATGLRVANLGRAGYGPQQELVVLQRYALALEPEVVLWVFYAGNDLKDMDRYEEIMAGLDRLPKRASLVERTFSYNALLRLFSWFERCEPSDEARRRSGLFRARSGEAVRMYFGEEVRPLDAADLGAVERFREILAAAWRESAGRGARLVLVVVPEKFRVHHGLLEFPERSDCAHWVPDDLPARLEALGREVSPEIGFLDLTPALAAEAARGEIVYFPDDTHWTDAGHRVAARAIDGYLRERMPDLAPKVRVAPESLRTRPAGGPTPSE